MEKVGDEDGEESRRLDGAATVSGTPDVSDRTMTVSANDVVDAYDNELSADSSLTAQWLHPLDGPDADTGRPIEGAFLISLIDAADEDLDDEGLDEDTTDEPPDQIDAEERLNLVKVLAAAREAGFSGPVFEVLAEFVGHYALGVVQGWLRSGRMWTELAALRWGVTPHPRVKDFLESESGKAMRENLASDIVYAALKRWQKLERAGHGFNPCGPASGTGRPASLRTWFVKVCVRECPNTFRRWSRDRDNRSQLAEITDQIHSERPIERVSAATFYDPEHRTIVLDDLERQLAVLDETELEVVELKASKYTHAQIAASTGRSITEIDSLLRKLQRRAQRSGR